MNTIDANIRETKTKGDVNTLRINGELPGIIYGGTDKNQKVSVSKKTIKILLNKENFLSNILTLKIDGKTQDVLPREIKYDVVSDEPIHLDFFRVIKGATITLNIPVKFINHETSPGLKRGGVLNIVRRKIELKCPAENIPTEIVIDLDGVDIGESFKISSVKLPDNVKPTILGRDFVIATLAAPTVMKEPEKPAETTEAADGAEASTEGASDPKAANNETKDTEKKEGDEKKTPSEKK